MFGLQVLTGTWELGNVIDENENGQTQVLGSVGEKMRLSIADVLKKEGWNDLKVAAIDAHVTVHLNGVRTVNIDYPTGPKVGHVSLKLRDSTQLEIKEIEIAELPET